MITFRIVDCWSNELHEIVANDYCDALRKIRDKVGHLSVMFV